MISTDEKKKKKNKDTGLGVGTIEVVFCCHRHIGHQCQLSTVRSVPRVLHLQVRDHHRDGIDKIQNQQLDLDMVIDV